MHPIDKYLVPIVNLSGNVKQIARRNPRQAGLACGTVLIIIGIIMAVSGPAQPKGPIIQPLSLPNLSVASPELSSALAISSGQTLVRKDAVQSLVQGSPQGAAPALTTPAPVVLHNEQWKEITLRPRDNATRLFNRLGVDSQQIKTLQVFAKKNHLLKQLKAGQVVRALVDVPQRQLKQLDYPLSTLDILTIKQGSKGWTSTVIHRKPDITLKYAANTIHGSLRSAAARAGLPSNLISQLSNIFSSDNNLIKNIRPGDKLGVLYEAFYLDGKRIGTGNILEAEVTTRGKVFRALRYTNPKGVTNYYTPQGFSLQRAFVRTPVRYSHISSLFSFNRNHPLLHIARPHQGVDFAAPRGTPIKATADGKIVYMGYKGSYGNAVMLNHGGTYSTLYGHMMCFARGLRNGAFVHQHQVIGYVGSTGLASGPHVHYEVLVNGVHRNPLTVPLPNSRPISPSYRAEFFSKARALMAKLAVYRHEG